MVARHLEHLEQPLELLSLQPLQRLAAARGLLLPLKLLACGPLSLVLLATVEGSNSCKEAPRLADAHLVTPESRPEHGHVVVGVGLGP